MIRVFLADSQPEARSVMRLLLQDLNMQVVGDAADWPTTLWEALDLIPHHTSLQELRATWPP